MPFEPLVRNEQNDARDWFGLSFFLFSNDFHPDSRDWQQLMVWDAAQNKLVPALTEAEWRNTSDEKKQELYNKAVNYQLYYYAPGDIYPTVVSTEGFLTRVEPLAVMNANKPVVPPELPPFTEEAPAYPRVPRGKTKDDPDYQKALAQYNEKKEAYSARKSDHELAVSGRSDMVARLKRWERRYELIENTLPKGVESFAAENAEARRSQVLSNRGEAEARVRAKRRADYHRLYRNNTARDIVNAVFSNQPRHIAPIVYHETVNDIVLNYDRFNELGKCAYDLPEGCPLSADEVSLLNFAAMGSKEIIPLAYDMSGSPADRLNTASSAAGTFNMVETGLLFTSRHSTDLNRMQGGLLLGKQLVEDFTAGNYEHVGRVLGEAIRLHNSEFSSMCDLSSLDKGSCGVVVSWMLEMLEKHPQLTPHTGLTPEELAHAKGEAAMNRVAMDASRARIRLQRSAEGLETLTREQKRECTRAIALESHISRSLARQYDIAQNSPEALDKLRKQSAEAVRMEREHIRAVKALGKTDEERKAKIRELFLKEGGKNIETFDLLAPSFSPLNLYEQVYGSHLTVINMVSIENSAAQLLTYQQLGQEGGLDALKQEIEASAEVAALSDSLTETQLLGMSHTSLGTAAFSSQRELKLAQDLTAVVQNSDGAFIRSSRQFKATQRALAAWMKELETPVDGALSPQQTEYRRKLLTDLEEAARSYLTFKGQMATGASESTNGKNLRENRRIAAIRRVLFFARDSKEGYEGLAAAKSLALQQEAQGAEISGSVQPPAGAVTGEQLEEAVAGFTVAAMPPQDLQDRDNIAHDLHVEVGANLQAVFSSAAERAKKSGKSTVEINEAEKQVFKETIAKALILNQINKGAYPAFTDPRKTPAEIRKAIRDDVKAVVDRDGALQNDALTSKRMLGILNRGPDKLLTALASRLMTGKDDTSINYGHKPPEKVEQKQKSKDDTFIKNAGANLKL